MRDYRPVDTYWMPHSAVLCGLLAVALSPLVPAPWTLVPALTIGTFVTHLAADRLESRPLRWGNAALGALVGAAGGALGAVLISALPK